VGCFSAELLLLLLLLSLERLLGEDVGADACCDELADD